MRFQPVTRNMMQLTKKHNKIQASYTLAGNVESIKYLGVTITGDLKNSHIRNVCSKANTENSGIPGTKFVFLPSRCKRSSL